jgi:hypothetical protein
LSFVSTRRPAQPTAEIEFDCAVTDPTGRRRVVPGYWAGENVWRVRYAADTLGRHEYVTRCSDPRDGGLHDRRGAIEVTEYAGANPLFAHGALRVSDDGVHLAHADGTPFFWLGDTWWFAPVGAFRWPDIVQTLTADRVAKGFTVIQLVAGLFPEMEPLGERGANEGGLAWQPGFVEINPAYFDAMDRKIDWIVEAGLVPCIVGAWGYFLTLMGEAAMKRHWRYLVARYGAYPIVWCLAGEASLPYYTEAFGPDSAAIKDRMHEGWAELARYVRAIDPVRRLLTVHPCPVYTRASSEVFADPTLYDVDMLQTGHTDRHCFDSTLRTLIATTTRREKPVVNGEVCYEGIMGSNWHDTQRFLFWTHMLSGAAGHTYGNLSIAVFTTREDRDPGLSRCNDNTWDESYDLPGSRHVGIGRRMLERYDWQRFEPHPEWVDPHWTEEDRILPYAAGIPGRVRVIYFPGHAFLDPHGAPADWPQTFARVRLRGIEAGVEYVGHFHNPRTGDDLPAFPVRASAGDAELDAGFFGNVLPTREDWVLVLEARPRA